MKCVLCGESHDDGEPVWLTNHQLGHLVSSAVDEEKMLRLLTQDFRRLVEILEKNEKERVQMQLDINHLAEVHGQVRVMMEKRLAEVEGTHKTRTEELSAAINRLKADSETYRQVAERIMLLERTLHDALDTLNQGRP
jgi:tRNA G26 N,N-dimethylase Trm1